jgi:hypothetical protein
MPLDLMEAVRPSVDRYLIALVCDRVFRASDFHETQRGGCRLLATHTHELAETLPAWRKLIALVAERVPSLLLKRDPPAVKLATPLTEANRRADRARRDDRTNTPTQAKAPRPERRCKRCGGELPNRTRVYCDDCLPHHQRDMYDAFAATGRAGVARKRAEGIDPSHGGEAREKRGATMSRRRYEVRNWDTTHPDTIADPDFFAHEILPGLQRVPLSELARATGLTAGYLSQIRRARKCRTRGIGPPFSRQVVPNQDSVEQRAGAGLRGQPERLDQPIGLCPPLRFVVGGPADHFCHPGGEKTGRLRSRARFDRGSEWREVAHRFNTRQHAFRARLDERLPSLLVPALDPAQEPASVGDQLALVDCDVVQLDLPEFA